MAANNGEIPGPSKKSKLSGESIVDLKDVVKILVKDVIFIQNWKKFYNSLHQPSSKFVQWDNSFKNNTMTIDQILIEMLSHWVLSLGKEAKVRRLYASLISEEFMLVAEDLKSHFDLSSTIVQMTASFSNQSTNSEVDTAISFDLCEPTDNFVGRAREIEMLDTCYQQISKLVVVSGLGVVGKSELVRKFGIKFRNVIKGNCIWIQGETEESFKNSIRRLAGRLKLESDSDVVDMFVDVCNGRLKQRPILIIVDNVDKRNSLVKQLIRGCKSLLENIPLIIVTTRDKSALKYEGEKIELDMLNPEEALEMVTNGLGSWISTSDATKLCDTLAHFPLVLQQAISFIKQKRCQPLSRNFGILEYLELFDKEKTKLLDYALNDDSSYNSTTLITWRLILDDLKLMNGSIGLLAVDILRTLPYFDVNGLRLSRLVELYQNVNMSSDKRKLDLEEIKEAVELIRTYSMCRVDGVKTTKEQDDFVAHVPLLRLLLFMAPPMDSYHQSGPDYDFKISSHRLIREFMLLTSDSEMDKEIIRRLFFVFNDELDLDKQNVNKLGQSYKTFVSEMFTKFWNFDSQQICRSHLETYEKVFYETLEDNGLPLHFVLNPQAIKHTALDALITLKPLYADSSVRMIEDIYKIYQYVRRKCRLDHTLTKSIQTAVLNFICSATNRISIVIRFLVDFMDDGFTEGLYGKYSCKPIVDNVRNGDVTREMTDLVVELQESLINWYNFNEIYSERFTFLMLATISQFFKQNGDTDRYNQIQSKMLSITEHPSELTAIFYVFKTYFGIDESSFAQVALQGLFSNNCNGIVNFWTFRKILDRLDSNEYKHFIQLVEHLFHESKGICHLDLFAIVFITLDWGQEKYRHLLANSGSSDSDRNWMAHIVSITNISNGVDSYLRNKDLLIRVIKTIKVFKLGDNEYEDVYDDDEHEPEHEDEEIDVCKEDLLSLYTEIMKSVENGLVDRYEGIWSLGEIYKCLWSDFSYVKEHTKLIDILERLITTENEKNLFTTILYSVVNEMVENENKLKDKDRSCLVAVFLRLQRYGLFLPILKEILRQNWVWSNLSVKQMVTIGDNIIANHNKGFLKKSDTFLSTKYVVKAILDKKSKKKALGILFRTLNVEHCSALHKNPKNALFDEVQLRVVDLDDINIAIATFMYLMECWDLDDPQGFVHPSLILQQILRILCEHTHAPTKLLALCYEIYNYRFGWNKLYLCWTFIKILKCLVEIDRNEVAERFFKRVLSETNSEDEMFWYCHACWFLVLGTYHYEAQSDDDYTSHILEVDDFVNELKVFEASITD